MTIKQKINYLLANGYTQEGASTYPYFYSKNRSKRYSIQDITLSWNSLQIH